MPEKVKKGWTTTKLMAIGSLAALNVILSLPGAFLAGLTGLSVVSEVGNVVIISLFYPLVALLFRQFGSVTLWGLISGVLFIPFPVAGPPGFVPKVLYIGLWGLITDLVYILLRRSEKITAIAIGIIQIGPGALLAGFFWKVLGAPELAYQYAKLTGIIFVIVGSSAGGALGYLSYVIYKRLENTALVKRIQREQIL